MPSDTPRTPTEQDLDPFEFEAESSNASKRGLLAVLRSVTATIAELDETRYEFEIEITECDDDDA